MIDKYNSCNNCKYFKRLYIREDNIYRATIYGLCQKRKRVFSDKYYCGSYTEKGESYDNSKSKQNKNYRHYR